MDRNLVSQFIEITGVSEAIAAQYLSLTDGNLESAVSLLFEAGGSVPTLESDTPPIVTVPDEPEIRAPILPTQEVLVPPDITCSFPRASNHVFDRFRDFAVETRRQEEEMTHRAAVGTKRTSHHNKQKRLEDLFRPPCDILFFGSFNEAREYAKSVNRWLIVNVQNQQEFACQILNRDVWSNKQVREIIKDHFVLLQIISSTDDGRRYIDFYKVTNFPYLAIIDPRTGECMKSYNDITVDNLVFGLNDMLSTNPSPENVAHESNFQGKTAELLQNDANSNSNIPTNTKRTRLTDQKFGNSNFNSEFKDSRASTSLSAVNNSQNIISKRSRIDEMTSKEEEMQKIIKDEVADYDGPICKLCLRLPDGNKETITMPAIQTVETFVNKIHEMGYDSQDYTYLIPFPKTNIGELSKKLRLLETILYPSNTVFITKI